MWHSKIRNWKKLEVESSKTVQKAFKWSLLHLSLYLLWSHSEDSNFNGTDFYFQRVLFVYYKGPWKYLLIFISAGFKKKMYLYCQLLAVVDKSWKYSHPWRTKACHAPVWHISYSLQRARIKCFSSAMFECPEQYRFKGLHLLLQAATGCPSRCWISISCPITSPAGAGQQHLNGSL